VNFAIKKYYSFILSLKTSQSKFFKFFLMTHKLTIVRECVIVIIMRSLNKRKILFLLAAGVSLGIAHSPQRHFTIVKKIPKEWRKMKRRYLRECINEFYKDKLVDFKEHSNGLCTMMLTEKGKKKVVALNADNMEIKRPAVWDHKWRVVISDIPESERPARNALRERLKNLSFYSWQKSVFVHPHDCLNEIEFLVELFQVRPYVRFFETSKVMNEEELLLHFEDIL